MFSSAITRSVISARVGNQAGKGQVELEEVKTDASGQPTIEPSGKIVEVFSIHGTEIPVDTYVSVAIVDGHWQIMRVHPKPV